MIHPAAICLTAALALPACSDLSATNHSVAVAGQVHCIAAPPASPPSCPHAGLYTIDTSATSKCCGFFGAMVANAVAGSTLRLAADNSYSGSKDNKPHSKGTWQLRDGRLTLRQTHESGQPMTRLGVGQIHDGVLTVQSTQQGIDVTLVFRRS